MLRASVVLALGACSATSKVTVRLAEVPPVASAPSAERYSRAWHHASMGCDLRGPPLPELFEPVVAFARAHLVDGLDAYDRNATTPVHVHRTSPHLPIADHERGVFIDVDPRTVLGRLTVGNRWTGGAAVNGYCLRVIREHGHTTVLVEPRYEAISAR